MLLLHANVDGCWSNASWRIKKFDASPLTDCAPRQIGRRYIARKGVFSEWFQLCGSHVAEQVVGGSQPIVSILDGTPKKGYGETPDLAITHSTPLACWLIEEKTSDLVSSS